jgi:hypothetical protein
MLTVSLALQESDLGQFIQNQKAMYANVAGYMLMIGCMVVKVFTIIERL